MPAFARAATPHDLADSLPGVVQSAEPQRYPADHLALPQVITGLAGQCVSVATEAIDEVLQDGLRQIGALLHMNGVIVWQQRANAASAFASHGWVTERGPCLLAASQLHSVPLIASNLEAGTATWFTRVDDVSNAMDRELLRRYGLRSAAVIPLAVPVEPPAPRAAMIFTSMTTEREWTAALLEQLRLIASVFSQALARKAYMSALQRTRHELRQLRERMTGEAQYGPNAATIGRPAPLIVSESEAIRRALAQVEQVASTSSTVLLLGETGVGKEVFAQAIHELSGRRQQPMVKVSCAAIPDTLIESELFGRERGAYTGALTRQVGRFEAAHRSTLFLDEIGELSTDMQVKLLRVLQERVVERLGGTEPINVDVRIIAATNRNLEKAIEDKSFREDLFYRLNVFPIVIPPLRERAEDIPGLAWQFIDEVSASVGKSIKSVASLSMRQLQRYTWPGNVRELRNVIERAVIMAEGPCLSVAIPHPASEPHAMPSTTLKDLETEHIRATLAVTNWRIRGRAGAAERLGLPPTTLEARMARLGIVRPKPLE